MAEIKDIFYHGVRQQVRRVLMAMGPERIEMGLTAFETGESSWSDCFFARAFPELDLNEGNPERTISDALGMHGNYIPMRIVYVIFDGAGAMMTKTQLKEFIVDIVAGDKAIAVERNAAIEDLIRSTTAGHDFQQAVWAGTDPEGWKHV